MAATSPASTPMASVKSTGVGCPLTWLMIQPPAQPRAAPSRAVIRVRKVTRAIRSARVTPRVRRRPRSRRRINTSANTTAATKNPPADLHRIEFRKRNRGQMYRRDVDSSVLPAQYEDSAFQRIFVDLQNVRPGRE